MAKRLEIFAKENFPLVEPGDFLPRLILDSLDTEQISLRQGDVLVLSQKIVSRSENRYVKQHNACKFPKAQRADKQKTKRLLCGLFSR